MTEPQKYVCPMHPDVSQDIPGICGECGMNLAAAKASASPRTYSCPMHPEVMQEKPGMCPECGMSLAARSGRRGTGDKGHDRDKRAGPAPAQAPAGTHSTNIFKKKFWVSFALSVPIVLYADIVQEFASWRPPDFPGSGALPFTLGSVVFFYGGSVFLASALRELRARLPGMMTLISIAIVAAYSWSVYALIAGQEGALYWELSTLITIMLLGHWLEMRAVAGAQGALKELSKLLPDTAEIVTSDKGQETRTVPLAELKEGDTVLVRPGGKIPADGTVVEGDSDVNESIATGESKPVAKKPGGTVIAGTVNGDGSLTIRIDKIGDHTFLAGVMRLVAEAQASKSRLQMLSDRAAYYLTIVAVVGGFITLVSWLAAGADSAFAVSRLVAVLVIACPHALGLAVPLVASISTTKAARNGFLVKQRLALEAARNIDVVLFDKTGTLTKGNYGVVKTIGAADRPDPSSAGGGLGETDILRLAASVNAHSEHPVAKAILAGAREKRLELAQVGAFARIPGKGVEGTVDGEKVFIGGEAIIAHAGASFTAEFARRLKVEAKKGWTVVYVVRRGAVAGAIGLADVIREESREAVAQLKRMGVGVAMITGDADDVAKWVAGELGIDQYFARVLPNEKSEKVKLLQSQGKRVAMVGDGINDAPALTQADLGIAIGAGTNVALESAGIILVRDDPRDIPKIIRLSRFTYTKMLQNLFWASGYNVVAIPLAAGALAFRGIVLEPAFAAALMSLSTVIVSVNAVLLKRRSLAE